MLIEGARRVDEQKRFVARFKDPYELLGVRDLPDPMSRCRRREELFGIIDGHHTVARWSTRRPCRSTKPTRAEPDDRGQLDRERRPA